MVLTSWHWEQSENATHIRGGTNLVKLFSVKNSTLCSFPPSLVNILFGSFQKNSLNFSQTSIWTRTGNFSKFWNLKIPNVNKIFGKSGKVIKFCKKVTYFTPPKRWVILRETSTFDRFMTFMSDLIQFFWLDCSLSQFWFSNYNFGLPLFKSNELKKKKIMIGLKLKKSIKILLNGNMKWVNT